MNKKCAVFSDCDLDGLGTTAVFKWYTNLKFQHEICSQGNFRRTFEAWLKKNKISDYDKIYIFDLDVSQNCIDLVDHKNVTIIDHHESHVKNKNKYKNANVIVENYSSCCKLMFRLLKEKYKTKRLTPQQKMLILLVDDYDSYELKLKNSYNLNVIVWNYQGNRAEQFMRDFGDGFYEFNQQHLNMIHMNNKRVFRVLSDLEIFTGEMNIAGNKTKLYATMATECLNEVAGHVIDNYDCDICLIINPKTSRVSFRKGKSAGDKIDLGALAVKIAEGGGHEYASGGKLTETVLAITKMLKPV